MLSNNMKALATIAAYVTTLQISGTHAQPQPQSATAWHPKYANDFNAGTCVTTSSPAPNGIRTYPSQLSCCENEFAGQSSGLCISQLSSSDKESIQEVWFPVYEDESCASTREVGRNHGVNGYETQLECCLAEYGHGSEEKTGTCIGGLEDPPTASPTPEGGGEIDFYYADYSHGWNGGSCKNTGTPPVSCVQFTEPLGCCEQAFCGQSSGNCIISLPEEIKATLDIEWYAIYSNQTCVLQYKQGNANAGVRSYGTQLQCCLDEFGHGGKLPDNCLAGLPEPPTTSPTPVGGAVLDVWYPDFPRGWNDGICINKSPAPNNIITHESQLACCQNAYAGQSTSACLFSLPSSVKATLDIIWFPVYSDAICVSTEFVPRNHGVNGYGSQLECCLTEYGHGNEDGMEECFAGLPNPPTTSPTPVGGAVLDFYYADYSLGWSGGSCKNTGIAPTSTIQFKDPLDCCEQAFRGQSSGGCVKSLPEELKATLPSEWSADYSTQTCTIQYKLGNANAGIRAYETQLQCCTSEFGHGAEKAPISCLQEIPGWEPDLLTGSSVWFPDYSSGWSTGLCVEGSVSNGVIAFDSQVDCCETAYAGQSSGHCILSTIPNDPISPLLTPSPSPPPQDLTRRSLAEKIDKLFDSKNHASLTNDRDQIRAMIEDIYENAQDVEDIYDFYEDNKGGSQNSSHNGNDDRQPSLFSIEREVILVENESDDYFDGLPDFAKLDLSDPFQCKCVDCKQDTVCGGIWKGEFLTDDHDDSPVDAKTLQIHIVVSHCKGDLDWIPDYIKGFDVASIYVVSKCGQEVVGAPAMATIEVQPNIGGIDHTYAYYITTILPQIMVANREDKESVAVFLKDDLSAVGFDQSVLLNDFESLVRAAAGDHGFRCGITPGSTKFGEHSFVLSAYHETETLHSFSMDDAYYGYTTDHNDMRKFSSEFKTLGSWWKAMGADQPQQAVQVCHGGVFSASCSNINRRDLSVWKNIETSLSRGINIQEGHFVERSWATLLSTPLAPYQLEALLEKADGVHTNINSHYHGALIRNPKLYLHIGAEGTSSTEVLTESLVEKMELLELDGYKIAVHGKYDDGKYGFPNIDRLGSCLWSDMTKSLFPAHMKEAIKCDEKLLPALSKYMQDTSKESHDMIMLNPWLVHPGTAQPLSIYLDPIWDVRVVVYYRRFFEWIEFKYAGWRQDLFKNSLYPDTIPLTSLRYIDFVREYCKRLFYGKDTNEEGFPVRKLHRYDTEKHKKKVELSENDFDPTTNFDLAELTGLEEYVYFVAKQYHSQSRFHQIEIVNYHDTHDVETNFYCHVLHDAPNSCTDAAREGMHTQKPQIKPVLALSPSIALEDIAIKAFATGRLSFDASSQRKHFVSQISLWTGMMALALQLYGIPIENLPVECLYKYERRRLLDASLAYEKHLLPDFFASVKGASELQNDFEEQSFCSVDTDAILSDSQWDFLFEDASNFTISEQRRAFVHIATHGTAVSYVERAIDMDRGVLLNDSYMSFSGHGLLTSCISPNKQRDIVTTQGWEDEDVLKCPDHLLSHFNEFLSDAVATDSDVIISDESLIMPSSEMGLLEVIDGFEPTIVLYYHRFFDWILSSYYQWHRDVDVAVLKSMKGRTRLIDFTRSLCSRLFASKLHSSEQSNVNLPDTPEYTYHLWKRYIKIPAYEENIVIMNYHDDHHVETFYCDVLDAEKACKLERLRKEEPVRSHTDLIDPKYVEMAMGLDWGSELTSMERIHELAYHYEQRMAQRGLSEDDLPTECLSQAEMGMLLKVSMEYERMLLPQHHSLGGEEEMRERFAKLIASDTFCSVDLEMMLDSLKWQFVLEPFDGVVA